jgi:hypothetical protein
MDDRGIVVRLPARAIKVCLLQSYQTGPANHPFSFCSLGAGCYFPRRVKRPRHKSGHSPPSSVEVKMSGVAPPLTRMPLGRAGVHLYFYGPTIPHLGF